MRTRRLLALVCSVALVASCSSDSDAESSDRPSTEADDGSAGGESASFDSGDGDGSGDDDGDSGGSRSSRSTTTTAPATTTTAPPPELPRGGRQIFPDHRVVANYGNPVSAAMGILGETGPGEAAALVEAAAAPFAQPGRPVLPAFELIVTVAQAKPGADGDYSEPTDPALIQQWLMAARAAKMLLILDIQPGRSHFLPEVQRYEQFLREPDVGLALDSEWRMEPGEVPGKSIGTVTAAEVNEVSAWLADLTAAHRLPEKLFVLHQFTDTMISGKPFVLDRPGLASVYHVDGFGGQQIKLEKYAVLKGTPPFASGFKLFHDEDTDMMEPAEVLAMTPAPDLITYQ